MQKYEIMTITDVELGEEGAQTMSNSVKDLISDNKGKVLDSKFWGKRKFAYEINKRSEGFYDVIEFEMPTDKVELVRTKLNLQNGLVRYLISAVK